MVEYTVQKLGQLAGVSSRTLRYYDEIGILKPARMNSSGYRIYGQKEVDQLQQILFYRELGLHLDQIKELMSSADYNGQDALIEHHKKLLDKRQQLDLLIRNVEKTIAAAEGRIIMSNEEKFEGFKQKKIEENEKKYGKEIREKYGDATVDEANLTFKNMSQAQHDEAKRLEEQIKETLAEAFKTGNPEGESAQLAAELHKKWIMHYWKEYSKEAHAGLADLYVEDERFKQYYDQDQPGTAEFLRDAIKFYVQK